MQTTEAGFNHKIGEATARGGILQHNRLAFTPPESPGAAQPPATSWRISTSWQTCSDGGGAKKIEELIAWLNLSKRCGRHPAWCWPPAPSASDVITRPHRSQHPHPYRLLGGVAKI